MSLKAFHIFFISVSMLLGMFVGAWGVRQYLIDDSVGGLALGIFFYVTAAALLVYGIKFIDKVRELGI